MTKKSAGNNCRKPLKLWQVARTQSIAEKSSKNQLKSCWKVRAGVVQEKIGTVWRQFLGHPEKTQWSPCGQTTRRYIYIGSFRCPFQNRRALLKWRWCNPSFGLLVSSLSEKKHSDPVSPKPSGPSVSSASVFGDASVFFYVSSSYCVGELS